MEWPRGAFHAEIDWIPSPGFFIMRLDGAQAVFMLLKHGRDTSVLWGWNSAGASPEGLAAA